MWLILSPLSWLLVAVLVACISMRLRKRRRIVLGGCIVLATVAAIAMTPLFANFLLGHLENPGPGPSYCRTAMPVTAVVLAGGVSGKASGPDDLAVLGLASRRRLDRAVAWWRSGQGRRLVMSGGSWFDNGIADGQLMRNYARRLGVPASAIATEEASLTTWESAQRLAVLQPRLPRRVALVTSAAHMPRAAYAMQQAGFEICQVAADRRQASCEFPGCMIPQRSALEKTEDGLHEVVGLLYYRWLAFKSRR